MYKNMGYNTNGNRAEMLKRVLNVQKRTNRGVKPLDFR